MVQHFEILDIVAAPEPLNEQGFTHIVKYQIPPETHFLPVPAAWISNITRFARLINPKNSIKTPFSYIQVSKDFWLTPTAIQSNTLLFRVADGRLCPSKDIGSLSTEVIDL